MIKIALLGCGTVGSGVIKLLEQNKTLIENRTGTPIELAKVFTRTPSKCLDLGIPQEKIAKRFDEICDDPEIQIIVELMGGIEPALTYIVKAMKAKKNIVTANKDLIASHGFELFESARENNVDLYFDASVGGGIPLISPFKQSFAGNKASSVMGILNGTTNYILTKMTNEGLRFEDVLKEAQELGYAEADPTADVGGFDAGRKISILASIAFNSRVRDTDVYCEGITDIEPIDFDVAKRLGYVIKLLAIAKESDGKIQARVHPVFLPKKHPLASVNDTFNAVFYTGDAVDSVMLYGRGAGQMPTASSVVGDIIDVCHNILSERTSHIGCTCFETKEIQSILEVSNKFYIRMRVFDKPGVLAKLAGVFGNFDVSLSSVIQEESDEQTADIYLITHKVKEENLKKSLDVLVASDYVEKISTVIRLEGV